MSWVMVGITAVSAGLQIGGALGKNKDAQTAGGLVGLLGSAAGGASGMGGGATPSGGSTNLFGMESAGGSPGGFDLFGTGGAASGSGGSGMPLLKEFLGRGLVNMGSSNGQGEESSQVMGSGSAPSAPGFSAMPEAWRTAPGASGPQGFQPMSNPWDWLDRPLTQHRRWTP